MFNVNLTNNINEDNELNEFLSKLKIDYNKMYRGIVIDNNDPEKMGRVKVRIPQIQGADKTTDYYVTNNEVPWANCGINPAGNDCGVYLPPNIGDTVYVMFEAGDWEHPIYLGGLYTLRKNDDGIKATKSNGLSEEYVVTRDDLPSEVGNGNGRIIYKSLKGAVIVIDDTDTAESIKIIDQSGQSIIMENVGKDILPRRDGKLGNNIKSQIVLTNNSGDSITLSHGKIHLKSANIIIETDNFVQKGIEDNFTDEENVADMILGN